MTKNFKTPILFAGALFVIAGCQSGSSEPVASTPVPPLKPVNFEPNVDAGVPVAPETDPTMIKRLGTLVAAKYPSHNSTSGAFKLRPSERAYEEQQGTERLFSSLGFTTEYSEVEEVLPPTVTIAPPFQRLSGIVVGDSIVALLETSDGTTRLVRPGQAIPEIGWKVTSIDEGKAVFTRVGQPNVQPRVAVVRLETAPPGSIPAGGNVGGPGGPPFGGPGGPPFGGPGGPPGGLPGGRGGRGGGRGDDF
ncbi:MAG: hypothetical protein SFX74_02785 [Fimbriimonadaceae bacterium]|nr:hypothetical protein [Fimbriimonadaceae bacterium]